MTGEKQSRNPFGNIVRAMAREVREEDFMTPKTFGRYEKFVAAPGAAVAALGTALLLTDQRFAGMVLLGLGALAQGPNIGLGISGTLEGVADTIDNVRARRSARRQA